MNHEDDLLYYYGLKLFPSSRYTRTAFIPAHHMDTELKSRITGNLSTSLAAISQRIWDKYHPIITLHHILNGGTETFYQITYTH